MHPICTCSCLFTPLTDFSEDDSSEASDLDKFEEAYTESSRFTAGVDATALDRVVSGKTNDDVPGLVLDGGLDTLHTLANVPKSWPLARLTIPLRSFSKQLERLIEGYCMEVMATNVHPELIFFFGSLLLGSSPGRSALQSAE